MRYPFFCSVINLFFFVWSMRKVKPFWNGTVVPSKSQLLLCFRIRGKFWLFVLNTSVRWKRLEHNTFYENLFFIMILFVFEFKVVCWMELVLLMMTEAYLLNWEKIKTRYVCRYVLHLFFIVFLCLKSSLKSSKWDQTSNKSELKWKKWVVVRSGTDR